MLKPSTAKRARRRNQARRIKRRMRVVRPTVSPHRLAINRLRTELLAEEGLFCCFHGGVDWRCARDLLPRGAQVVVEVERPVSAGGRRYVPDLKVSCARTGVPLLLIEVWHTHAVNFRKRRAYGVLGLPWIEVKSWHVLHRYRKRPLPILDWGGAGMPEAPTQQALFDDEEVNDSTLTQPTVRLRERAPMPWSWTLLGQAASVMQGRQPPGL